MRNGRCLIDISRFITITTDQNNPFYLMPRSLLWAIGSITITRHVMTFAGKSVVKTL
jgi:hypothetical protein